MEEFDIQKFNKEAKKAKKKAERKEKLQKKLEWVTAHPDLTVFFVSLGLSVATFTVKEGISITKQVAKSNNLKREENLKNLYCYDNRLGKYWKLKRELSNQEWLVVEKRKSDGENLGEILDDLKVLK